MEAMTRSSPTAKPIANRIHDHVTRLRAPGTSVRALPMATAARMTPTMQNRFPKKIPTPLRIVHRTALERAFSASGDSGGGP